MQVFKTAPWLHGNCERLVFKQHVMLVSTHLVFTRCLLKPYGALLMIVVHLSPVSEESRRLRFATGDTARVKAVLELLDQLALFPVHAAPRELLDS